MTVTNTLKPDPIPNDPPWKRDGLADPWSLHKGELAAWVIVALMVPLMLLAGRSMSQAEAQPEVRMLSAPPSNSSSTPTPMRERTLPVRDAARLNLNKASAREVELLPGIGPSRAKAIVDYREKRGPFHSARDLTSIRGISPALADKLEPMLKIEP